MKRSVPFNRADRPPFRYDFGFNSLKFTVFSMARITVEDCLHTVDNLFDLVLLAAKRSRRLVNGAEARVDWENDKPTVVALREIAEGKITIDLLSEPDPEPEQELIPENPLDLGVDFRAPQLGLGD